MRPRALRRGSEGDQLDVRCDSVEPGNAGEPAIGGPDHPGRGGGNAARQCQRKHVRVAELKYLVAVANEQLAGGRDRVQAVVRTLSVIVEARCFGDSLEVRGAVRQLVNVERASRPE